MDLSLKVKEGTLGSKPELLFLGLQALSLSLTLAMVTLLGGVASLIGFWVVLGTNQFGKSKKSGSPKPLTLVSLVLVFFIGGLCVVAWIVFLCCCLVMLLCGAVLSLRAALGGPTFHSFLPLGWVLHLLALLLLWVVLFSPSPGGAAVSPPFFGVMLFNSPSTASRCCLLPPPWGGAAVPCSNFELHVTNSK